MERTVHRFHKVIDIVDFHRGIHAVLVEPEVSAGFPEICAPDMRRIQQVIAVRHVLAAPESFDEVADERTARMPQDKAGTDGFGNAEQVKFFADFAVVALFGFFDFLEILSEFFLIGERGAVNTGQHRIGFLAPVIRTGNAGQFECADVAGIVHMGTSAEIDEIAELIKRDRFAFGDIREAFQLEVLFLFRQEFDCFLASEFETGKRELFCGEPGHFFFDFHQILRCQLGCSEIEVVVKSVFCARADIEFDIGIQFKNRRRHQVRRAVPYGFERKLSHFILFLLKNNEIRLLIYILSAKYQARNMIFP